MFGVGGVLIDWDPRHLYRKLFGDEQQMEHFLREVCSPAWQLRLGTAPSLREACQEQAAKYPDWAPLIMAWFERNEEMVRGPVRGSVEVLGDLIAAGVGCYAVTNMDARTFEMRAERFPFLGWLDSMIVSGREGVAKPHPGVYRMLCERFGLSPAQTLVVDSYAESVAVASRMGFLPHRFTGAEALREHLEALGALTPRARGRDTSTGGPASDKEPRRAVPADVPRISEVVAAAYVRYLTRMDRRPAPIDDDHGDHVARGMLWVVGDPVVGVIKLEQDNDTLTIGNVAVHPDAQGVGWGRRLLDFAEEEARRRGLRQLRLYTNVAMVESLEMYTRRGYEEVDRRDDQGYFRVFLEKLLPAR